MIGITIQETARRLGLTVRQVRLMVQRNEIRWMRHGRFFLIHPDDVAALESRAWNGKAVANA